MQARIDLCKHRVGRVESFVKWGVLEEGLGLIVYHFVEFDIGDV